MVKRLLVLRNLKTAALSMSNMTLKMFTLKMWLTSPFAKKGPGQGCRFKFITTHLVKIKF